MGSKYAGEANLHFGVDGMILLFPLCKLCIITFFGSTLSVVLFSILEHVRVLRFE